MEAELAGGGADLSWGVELAAAADGLDPEVVEEEEASLAMCCSRSVCSCWSCCSCCMCAWGGGGGGGGGGRPINREKY